MNGIIRGLCLGLLCAVAIPCRGESAISLLSGFDAARIETVYPPDTDESAGELSKLVYRLAKVDPAVLESKVGSEYGLGDAVAIEGQLTEIRTLKVPDRLVEFLELTRLHVVVVASEDSQWTVVTTPLPAGAKPGDHVRGTGVVIESGDESAEAVASARLKWIPERAENIGWQLLGESGFDVSLLAEISTRSRRPLLAEDGDAFYSMLAAAAELKKRETLASPERVDPVQLLQNNDTFAGQWLRMDLETVQVTRISVTDPRRQAQLGSDHYYQIDTVGDLGNVIVKIERPAGDDGPPAVFENRYPVSLVVRELPEFLKQRIRASEGGDAVVSQIKWMVEVDAFFYRVWSYSTDFMNQHGGGDQFGPLLITAEIRNREPESDDPAGVGMIGWIAAAAVIVAILMTWFWNRRLAAQDRAVREVQKEREAEQLELP